MLPKWQHYFLDFLLNKKWGLQEAVSELAKSSGAVLLGSWDPSITHVIASTNENGACKRTLKVMMGILEGKWILSIKCQCSFLLYQVVTC